MNIINNPNSSAGGSIMMLPPGKTGDSDLLTTGTFKAQAMLLAKTVNVKNKAVNPQ